MLAANKSALTTFATPTDREVVITRVFDAPRRLVFEAWTNPKHIPRWMVGPGGWTMPVCEIDLRPGGAWHALWRNSDGSEMELRGVYREVNPPEKLVRTEVFKGWGKELPETLNTLIFSESAGKTTITITVLFPSMEARDALLKSGMKEGMTGAHDRLAEHLRAIA